MSALRTMLSPSRRRTDGVAPLLLLFLVPVLLVVATIALIASAGSWGLLALAVGAVVVLLAIVMLGIAPLLADDQG